MISLIASEIFTLKQAPVLQLLAATKQETCRDQANSEEKRRVLDF
jgi:hypothetical protein